MNKQHQTKFHWLLGVVAISLGAMGIVEPAIATPDQNQDFKLAQVGVRSRINGPTPLNISPPSGTHIPLPSSNYHRRSYYGYPRQRDYVKYRSYDRYGHDHYHTHRRRDRDVNIIINLPTHRSYNRYERYIRVVD